MKLAIMQPTFNPWLGYFDLIDSVDKFIFLDTVQLSQQSWQTRNKLKVQDKEFLFSIPIKKNKLNTDLLIKDVLINYDQFDFRSKLAKTLDQNYKKSKFYNEVNSFIQSLVSHETNFLSSYNINIVKKLCSKLNINTEIIVLSETNFNTNSLKGEQVLNICRFFEVSDYISPLGSKNYLDEVINVFNKNNLSVEYQHYWHPTYQQLGIKFIPYLGIFDLLYNEGFDSGSVIIKSGRVHNKLIESDV